MKTMFPTVRASLAAVLVLTVGMTAPSAGQAPGQNGGFDARDSLFAALGTATLECLGTVGPSLYTTAGGFLARTFRTCTTGNERALQRIDSILGVQLSREGAQDGLAEYFVTKWDAFRQSFPKRFEGRCPTWTLEHVIDAPTRESVDRVVRTGRIGVQYERYRVSSNACRGRGCAVKAALACAQGFGSQFVVDADLDRERIEIDPAWWLLDIEFENNRDNPFLAPGYCHGMSFYGNPPGALYGALERAGEKCFIWDYQAGKHRCDARLVPIECSPGWLCMSYCLWVPLIHPVPHR